MGLFKKTLIFRRDITNFNSIDLFYMCKDICTYLQNKSIDLEFKVWLSNLTNVKVRIMLKYVLSYYYQSR